MRKNILLWGMIAIIFISFLSVIIFMIYHPINTEKEKNKGIDYQELGSYISIEQLPEEYTFEQALNDGCFIITYKQIYNMERLEEFIENTKITNKNRTSDIIRIIQYTKEGNMLITDVCYQKHQNTYFVVTDNTRDKFAEAESKKTIMKNDFPDKLYGITKKEKEDYITLELSVYGEEKGKYENYEISSYLKNAKINKKGPDFIGIVEKINGKAVIVKTDDALMKLESDRYSFVIPEKQEIQLQEGDKVLITFTGTIRTTYPAQIDLLEIQKIDDTML